MARVAVDLDVAGFHRREEARPARARFELGARREQRQVAAHAVVDTIELVVPEGAAERPWLARAGLA